MLFNSPEFIFVFLPLAVMLHFALARFSVTAACVGTTATSLFCYLWWNPAFVVLPLLSMAMNFALGRLIATATVPSARRLMLLGVTVNLLVLISFKYADVLASLVGVKPKTPIEVPLGLAFTTLVQIAYLVDKWRRQQVDRFSRYAMFASFFPLLMAGPIVRWTELGAQITEAKRYRVDWSNIALGLTMFVVGFGKKILIADQLARFTGPVFEAAATGETVTMAAAWGAALCAAAQLYFNFSGYAEMAIGLGLLFNFVLPINFAAPFRSTSIIEFWRRWHITLSRFLRDFVYLPLGGSHAGTARTSINLVVAVALGGLWYGTGWTFLAWGLYNGVLLAINHAWRRWRGATKRSGAKRTLGWLATFTAFAIGMVFFLAADMPSALSILRSMAGLETSAVATVRSLPWDNWLVVHGYVRESLVLAVFGQTWTLAGTAWTLLALAMALLLPETVELMRYRDGEPHSDWRRSYRGLAWQPTLPWLAAAIVLFGVAFYQINNLRDVVYYQF